MRLDMKCMNSSHRKKWAYTRGGKEGGAGVCVLVAGTGQDRTSVSNKYSNLYRLGTE